MISLRFLTREIEHSGAQVATFVLCVALSIATISGLNGFQRDVYRSFYQEARVLHGGDLIVHSNYPFSSAILAEIEAIGKDQAIETSRTHRFLSMARVVESDETLLVSIKAVERNYPLYGAVTLDSGRGFAEVLEPGTVVVSPDVLGRLAVPVGTVLAIGEARLTIADVVASDPTRAASFFALGPRVYVSAADLDRLNLLGSASRVERDLLIGLRESDTALASIEARLGRVAAPGQERVETARNARSGVKRFLDNLFFFLSIISVFTLLLSGIGMQSSLSALVQRKRKTIAICKTLGASHRFLFANYLALVLTLALAGCLVGILGGYAIKRVLPGFLGAMLQATPELTLSIVDVAEGLALGLAVAVLFAFLPLTRLTDIRPVALFRYEESSGSRRFVTTVTALAGFALLSLLVIGQLEDVRIGLYVMAGSLGLILIIGFFSTLLLRLIKALPITNLTLRQAVKSFFRPGGASRPVVITLASAVTILLTIALLEINLFRSYIESYPEDAPNLFFLDIQKDQRQGFAAIVGEEVELFPVIRARLLAINGEPIDYEMERQRRSDSLAREFNLTYRDELLDDETIIAGGQLFEAGRTAAPVVEVSVLDTISDIGDIQLGDRLQFNIQGLVVEAEVTTIRSRSASKLHPFFYFVFPATVLEAAPQTLFAALQVDKQRIPGLIAEVVKTFANVSGINVAATAERVGVLLRRLAEAVTFFSSFSTAAGFLILVSGLLATRFARIREAVYYKVLGARSSFILATICYESLLLGLVCSLLGVVCGTGAAYGLCRFLFEIPFYFPVGYLFGVTLATVMLVLVIGVAASLPVVYQKPVNLLRLEDAG